MGEDLLKNIFDKLTIMEADIQSVRCIVTESHTQVMDELDAVRSELKSDIAEVNAKIDALGHETQEDVKPMLQHIDKKLDKQAMAILEDFKSVTEVTGDHEIRIRTLARRPFELRGDEISQLKEHLDERLDALQTDLSYVVSKVAQHDRNIVQLRKQAK
ncbi:hypothetical protein SOV_16990 [Sporomusa ovata DSM 2662]|uniref:Uncharacterized protein n=1 Tax=Sporomusa ovata TaxID=2378 RepID=A0A0U1KV56_9FIRM|nr:hypothetical protein [Sporomusa ovata]EQB29299.1 hypothetical protein SOV_1c10320 [Sporomusa ovata DSM 2662]CQR71340.1 hypothetical protein SpAn4DRAFT_3845 [Sporomusa ovata]